MRNLGASRVPISHSLRWLLVAALSVAAAPAGAQRMPDINGPKRAAQNAVDAENARLSAQTGQAIPVRRGTTAPAPAPAAPSGHTSGPGSVAPARTGVAQAGAPGALPPVTREVFSYAADGRRDPFYSLILTEELRPLLSDLKLVAILYEASGRRSVAIMRDLLTNAQYRVTTGMSLGRMRVAQIRPRVVLFTIDEFGQSRQDSLFLVDSTKVRSK